MALKMSKTTWSLTPLKRKVRGTEASRQMDWGDTPMV
jgi:hypothetical protein